VLAASPEACRDEIRPSMAGFSHHKTLLWIINTSARQQDVQREEPHDKQITSNDAGHSN
jgi:hypothetical protein